MILAALLLTAAKTAPKTAPKPPVWRTGDFVEARVELHMTNEREEIDLTELEDWRLSIGTAGPEGVQARLRRTLLETRLNGAIAPAPKGAAKEEPWTFLPNGALAFRPLPRTALESRLYRVLAALLPTPEGGDPAGRAAVEYPDEGAPNAPFAALGLKLGKRGEGLRAVDLAYREEAVRLSGRAAVDETNGWPLYWNLKITGLHLEGGDAEVLTTVNLLATKARVRGKDLPVNPKGS